MRVRSSMGRIYCSKVSLGEHCVVSRFVNTDSSLQSPIFHYSPDKQIIGIRSLYESRLHYNVSSAVYITATQNQIVPMQLQHSHDDINRRCDHRSHQVNAALWKNDNSAFTQMHFRVNVPFFPYSPQK